MRILLASNASYAPPKGGSTRSNLVWLAHLVRQGHACRVVCPGDQAGESTGAGGVSVLSVVELSRHSHVLGEEIRAFEPDWVLVSSEDVGHVLLREAANVAADRLIYLAHTPQFFPFGPASWNPDREATELVRRSRAVVAIGKHVAGYIREHCGVEARVIHPPIYDAPAERTGSGKDVLMVNPCEVKGIRIFAELARGFPEQPFAALRSWGTTSRDLELLRSIPNVRVVEPVGRIEEVLSQARVLLMPSLWYEGFGLIAMEAMLAGLPVIASDSGGLVEAKEGTGYVIPVRGIERYEPVFDETHMPKAVIPEQDIEPWVAALRVLLEDEAEYQREAERSRAASSRFVAGLRVEAFEEMLEELRPAPLRVLLVQNSLYARSHGGGDKSNRLLMEALAARGHAVRVVARGDAAADWVGAVNGVEVHALARESNMRGHLAEQVREFGADVIITSTDDPAQLLFDVVRREGKARLVHLVRATIAVPFGPDSSHPDKARAEALRHADAVVGVSEYVAEYVRQWGGMDAVHVPISLLEPGEVSALGRFDNPYVLMVNPCAVKGISIFVELAARMPEVRFAAVPTWGTNQEDLALLRSKENITVLEPVDDIDEILRQTRVLLVPSVWAEARSRIVVEAMLRGVPVIASDVGGIPEAKLGVDYLLPVNPVVGYRAAVDENMVPVAEVPAQDVGPWQAALERLVGDRADWERVSAESRRAALAYADGLSVEPFEGVLRKAVAAPKKAVAPAMSAERQRLLELLVRKKAAEKKRRSAWFPVMEAGAARVFCFPYAGGGTTAYLDWREALAGVCPVCLPGREARAAEAPFESMDALVAALAEAIAPEMEAPCVFFGHSMGAVAAFELVRVLRARGGRLPRGLIVSAARAPQFRLNHVEGPEPDEAAFVEELRRLEGMPREVLDNAELLRVALPALRADARLYRRYVYEPGKPLAIPIVAYGGDADANVTAAHLEAWREQTTGDYARREFAGGHFFIQSARDAVLRTLRADVAALVR